MARRPRAPGRARGGAAASRAHSAPDLPDSRDSAAAFLASATARQASLARCRARASRCAAPPGQARGQAPAGQARGQAPPGRARDRVVGSLHPSWPSCRTRSWLEGWPRPGLACCLFLSRIGLCRLPCVPPWASPRMMRCPRWSSRSGLRRPERRGRRTPVMFRFVNDTPGAPTRPALRKTRAGQVD